MVIRIVPSRISSMVGNWVVLDSYTPPARSRPLYPSPTVEWSIDTLPLTALFETASSKQDITHRICSDRHGRHVCPDRHLLSLIGVLLGLTLLFVYVQSMRCLRRILGWVMNSKSIEKCNGHRTPIRGTT
ncbi:uncharacterized protein PADG_12062 [Paracoccidioides brasiliensis Pb18]|uniref:Uncharacterized protein n=1 Tax=Paracoccidioides brasiliensis (strain Pb18) TaxID=502780 RepID=A0A0A0HUT7_PARBD|nr:uncharacterized protein PADG_12062 [Paracoccidioides brasiliensis Pb18]KGM91756.1 hypothetical protein PADG_12062 [Paracoccidioides brasiliensis Pb18]